MPLPELVRALERQADAERDAITAAATAEVSRIDRDVARARGDRVATAIAAATAACRIANEAAIAAAARSARAGVLTARAMMLERVRDEVRRQLPETLAADPALARELVDAALAYAGDTAGTLRCTPGLVELATGTRIDATLDARLDRNWPALACSIVARVT